MIVALFAVGVVIMCAVAWRQARAEERQAEREADRARMMRALRRMGE